MTIDETSTTHWDNKVRAGSFGFDELGAPDEDKISQYRERIEPWLAALLQAEHLNLLIGSGLTTAVAHYTCAPKINMTVGGFDCEHSAAVLAAATKCAAASGRGDANIEDAIRAANELLGGLNVLSTEQVDEGKHVEWARKLRDAWTQALDTTLVPT